MQPVRATMVMATYNHAAFIEAALASAFVQDYPALDILVADDASTDDTFARAERAVANYRGPHRVRLHRQASNVGPIANHRWLCENADTLWLVNADGDDLSMPDRVSKIMAHAHTTGASFITSNAGLIDEESQVRGLYHVPGPAGPFDLMDMATNGYRLHHLGATSAYERRLFTEFGFLEEHRLAGGGGDYVLPFRAGFFGGSFYLDEVLLMYRQHHGQMTRRITDRSQSRAVAIEGHFAYDVKNMIHSWDDAELWVRAHPDDPRAAAARRVLVSRILQATREWSELRTRMLAAGLRPTWIERAEFDARIVPDVFQGAKV
jgi:glycosyltransferase involved in cell wall biosynthesis